ncbi:hypothetical protein I7I53_02450 [Histoplasma capsulatum var. duboisii H88]|uniref:Uncharacterized protein n=1 Tax=Ajellomyces capsulatus (strain H88) TaxID=544711 RepID=A0A8A1LLH5_AJEC8|nr:hypothetical protein I7I53_02450 [Histoplasma capsulatum var. duboisii H88]
MPSLHHFFSGTHHLVGSYATPPYIDFFRLISVQLHTVAPLRPATHIGVFQLPLHGTSIQLIRCMFQSNSGLVQKRSVTILFGVFGSNWSLRRNLFRGWQAWRCCHRVLGMYMYMYIRDQHRLPAAFFCLTAVFLFI